MNQLSGPENGPTETIAMQNDRFRRDLVNGSSIIPGRYMLTRGISSLDDSSIARILHQVATFSAFTAGNDPYGEHDFGRVEFGNHTIFWKIDYYDNDYLMGSPCKTDTSVTKRVLTVMLASEY